MQLNSHVDVTFDFSNWGGNMYDLRIPRYQTVKQLLINLEQTIPVPVPENQSFIIKVVTKNIVLAADDELSDYPVTNGDILAVI